MALDPDTTRRRSRTSRAARGRRGGDAVERVMGSSHRAGFALVDRRAITRSADRAMASAS